MGWVADQFDNRKGQQEEKSESFAESTFEERAARKWENLVKSFEKDVTEFRMRGGDANFKQVSSDQCRISNVGANIAAVVTADVPAHTVSYTYEPDHEPTAVPEEGVLTMRGSGNAVELYSADQRLTLEQARRLILQPLLFPAKSLPLDPTGT